MLLLWLPSIVPLGTATGKLPSAGIRVWLVDISVLLLLLVLQVLQAVAPPLLLLLLLSGCCLFLRADALILQNLGRSSIERATTK
jgi:hypothetical protein